MVSQIYLSDLQLNKANTSDTEAAFLCPRHDNGRGIKCYPCPSVRMYVRTYTYVRLSQRRPLSKSNTFDQNFMKLGHIV